MVDKPTIVPKPVSDVLNEIRRMGVLYRAFQDAESSLSLLANQEERLGSLKSAISNNEKVLSEIKKQITDSGTALSDAKKQHADYLVTCGKEKTAALETANKLIANKKLENEQEISKLRDTFNTAKVSFDKQISTYTESISSLKSQQAVLQSAVDDLRKKVGLL